MTHTNKIIQVTLLSILLFSHFFHFFLWDDSPGWSVQVLCKTKKKLRSKAYKLTACLNWICMCKSKSIMTEYVYAIQSQSWRNTYVQVKVNHDSICICAIQSQPWLNTSATQKRSWLNTYMQFKVHGWIQWNFEKKHLCIKMNHTKKLNHLTESTISRMWYIYSHWSDIFQYYCQITTLFISHHGWENSGWKPDIPTFSRAKEGDQHFPKREIWMLKKEISFTTRISVKTCLYQNSNSIVR